MISVIVPIYNIEEYISRCIESIINQTYKNLEIILIDDGSTDNSLSICKEYEKKDKRIKVIAKKNEGQGVARNYGLDICKGEYISFIDGDDYIKPNMYKLMIEAINFYKADLAICGFVRNHGFIEKEQVVPKKVTIYDNITLIKLYLDSTFITSSVCNKLYLRKLWEDKRFPSLRAREDVSVIHEVLHSSQQAVHIASCEYIQFVRPGSTERSKFNITKLNSIKASQLTTEFVNLYYPDLARYSLFKNAKTYVYLMGEIISTFQFFKYKEIYKQLLRELEIELEKTSSFKESNLNEYNYLIKIKNNQIGFFFKNILIGLRNMSVDLLKKISMLYYD